jgi:phage protein D
MATRPTPDKTPDKGNPEQDQNAAQKAPEQKTPEQEQAQRVIADASAKRDKASALADARAQLEQQLAQLNEAARAEGLADAPTHVLVLADGSRVESSGVIPTHYAHTDGRVLGVVAAFSLEGLKPNA